jgi:ankyrin repeat protein
VIALLLDLGLPLEIEDGQDGITPLWWLPDDEAKAMEIVEMLLAAGADPAIRSREGRTAMSLDLDDLRLILARHKGFDDWAALVKAIAAGMWVS